MLTLAMTDISYSEDMYAWTTHITIGRMKIVMCKQIKDDVSAVLVMKFQKRM